MGLWTALALGWIALAFVVRHPLLACPAFDPDNILSLSLGDRPLAGVFGRFFEFLPYYRPVGTFSVWIQYAVHGLAMIPAYFAVNLVLVGLCTHLFALLLYRLGAGVLPSVLAGAFFAVHPNTVTFATMIGERMNVLFLGFGFLALLALTALAQRAWPRRRALAVLWLALMLSALSKEIGLAFGLVVVVACAWCWRTERRPELALAAVGTCGVAAGILALHLGVVGFNPGLHYGECHAFLGECWEQSFRELGWARSMASLLYTAGANMAAAFAPFAFEGDGTLRAPAAYAARPVLSALLFTAVAVVGLAKAPPIVRVGAIALIVGHGLASAVLFRYRNHMASDAGAIALACFGVTALGASARARTWMRVLLVALVLAVIANRAVFLYRESRLWVAQVSLVDPELARGYVDAGASPRVIEVQRERYLRARSY